MKKIQAKYVGKNYFEMSIVQDKRGRLYADTNLNTSNPNWHTLTSNNIDDLDEGEPDMPIEILGIELEIEGLPQINRIEEQLKNQYMLLSRMLSDVKYYINMGGNGSCWTNSNNPQDGIDNMRKLWGIFPDDAKPEWCTIETIDAAEYVILHTDFKGIWRKWEGCDKTIARKLCTELMTTSFFNNERTKALNFIHQLYSYMDREDLEVELNKHI